MITTLLVSLLLATPMPDPPPGPFDIPAVTAPTTEVSVTPADRPHRMRGSTSDPSA